MKLIKASPTHSKQGRNKKKRKEKKRKSTFDIVLQKLEYFILVYTCQVRGKRNKYLKKLAIGESYLAMHAPVSF